MEIFLLLAKVVEQAMMWKVLLNTSWSALMESLGEKGFEKSSKLGFS